MAKTDWNKKEQRRKQFEDRLAQANKLSAAIKSGNLNALSSMIAKGSDALEEADADATDGPDTREDAKTSTSMPDNAADQPCDEFPPDASETPDETPDENPPATPDDMFTEAAAASSGLSPATDPTSSREIEGSGSASPSGPIALEDACPGKEIVVSTAAGEESGVYVIRRTLADTLSEDAHIAAEFYNIMRGSREYFHELESSAELCCIADASPQDVLFMDTETCGLKDAPIFLTGIMYYADGDLVFEQFLARDLSQEAGMLQMFSERLSATGVLVTFNGARFDMPLIRQRCLRHGVRLPVPDGPGDNRMAPHLDLLKEARRLWKGRLPNCRLGTIERRVLHRHREGDIASRAIPAAYKRFTESGDAAEMQAILHHNLIDLLSMAQLVCLLLTGCDPLIDA